MVSDRVLVERLKELEKEGIVTRNFACSEKSRSEYLLTEKGADLQKRCVKYKFGAKNGSQRKNAVDFVKNLVNYSPYE